MGKNVSASFLESDHPTAVTFTAKVKEGLSMLGSAVNPRRLSSLDGWVIYIIFRVVLAVALGLFHKRRCSNLTVEEEAIREQITKTKRYPRI
ncbi:MAG: hypothetical protein A2942_01055 [Candidatus Lloydbacteria bacterium RIFCSPLOWO2_01_FULL_50_20]|uniref:Uncharacterized protein n=1 Tax=Candidatus Lloydbacteria bacterium RIFCSPLOWO2_01_FULL_50_20 TaxID=1798665 RepID=A0A1G2DIJ0_9BACT|nr:MAG: hypothetical protein A3C13_01350 [Candidatus Lloydbacteria bacterium RIFCSPHIGHO2_02_FULL_50_11]OGZ13419.1 MAG: hypothetical protein A2942_01055 [Candidatus Lloydbacteria bacterium RIFCSPLOWO2_01_FULL_50_20]